jgi:hypothetical protein
MAKIIGECGCGCGDVCFGRVRLIATFSLRYNGFCSVNNLQDHGSDCGPCIDLDPPDGLAEHYLEYHDFSNSFTDDARETGVWNGVAFSRESGTTYKVINKYTGGETTQTAYIIGEYPDGFTYDDMTAVDFGFTPASRINTEITWVLYSNGLTGANEKRVLWERGAELTVPYSYTDYQTIARSLYAGKTLSDMLLDYRRLCDDEISWTAMTDRCLYILQVVSYDTSGNVTTEETWGDGTTSHPNPGITTDEDCSIPTFRSPYLQSCNFFFKNKDSGDADYGAVTWYGSRELTSYSIHTTGPHYHETWTIPDCPTDVTGFERGADYLFDVTNPLWSRIACIALPDPDVDGWLGLESDEGEMDQVAAGECPG